MELNLLKIDENGLFTKCCGKNCPGRNFMRKILKLVQKLVQHNSSLAYDGDRCLCSKNWYSVVKTGSLAYDGDGYRCQHKNNILSLILLISGVQH